MAAPRTPKNKARASLPPILSFNKRADKTATKTGPKDERRPAKLEGTVVSPKLSDKWYIGTISRATANSLGRSPTSNLVLGLPTNGTTIRKKTLAISHLIRAKLTGESSATARLIATKARPQKKLRTIRRPYLLACRQSSPPTFLGREAVNA
ncbi:MAG: hypothetical protein QXO67_04635 [Candidatus Bathyarchaeia archaeon]